MEQKNELLSNNTIDLCPLTNFLENGYFKIVMSSSKGKTYQEEEYYEDCEEVGDAFMNLGRKAERKMPAKMLWR